MKPTDAQTLTASGSGGGTEGEAETTVPNVRRAVLSAVGGTFVEYYDFAIYGAMAPLIAHAFFPSTDQTVALLNTFAVFAVAFVVRPLAGLIWGRLGDRIGRQKTLVIIISLMSFATMAIGLLPTFHTVGVLAPILLIVIRLIQGISAGGELPGAAIFIAEYDRAGRRGYLTSWLQVTTTAATVIGLMLVALLQLIISSSALNEWGWRIPFLLAGPMGLIGLYLRAKLQEPPAFRQLGEDKDNSIKLVSRRWIGQIFVAGGFGFGAMVGFYMLLTYMPTYLSKQMEFSSTESLFVLCAAAVMTIIAMPVFSHISDRVGRRPVMIISGISVVIVVWPSFLLLHADSVFLAVSGLILFAIPLSGLQGIALISALERFPTRIRYTGYAVTFGISAALFGGTSPYVSTFVVQQTEYPPAPAFYVMFAAAVTVCTAVFTRETGTKELMK